MPIAKVLAALDMADIEAARAWYEQLLGAPADDVPMAEAAAWHVTETGSIQLVQDAERAGNSWVTPLRRTTRTSSVPLSRGGTSSSQRRTPARDVPDRVDHRPRGQCHHIRRRPAKDVTRLGEGF